MPPDTKQQGSEAMGFSVFTVATSMGAGSGFGCSLKKTRGGRALLGFTVRPDIARELGWDSEKRLAVLLGDGSDHGLVRFRPDPDGAARLKLREAGDRRCGGAYFAIALGHVAQFVDRREPRRWVRFERLDDGWVEVVLPGWAEETAPARERVAARPTVMPFVAPQRLAAGELTGRLMGDPPPGRSALAQSRGAAA
jgi:hypothetical protein